MQTFKTILLILICTTVLGACGQKGPLYLPDEDPATTTGENEKADEDDTVDEEKDKGSLAG